jgi:antibiotic biosynthesis monooxygenase (ABM) superfamily enzyme
MATKKQRRRRAKEHRHDYVWVDEEGNEVDSPEEAGNGKGVTARPTKSSGRGAQPPSWRRSLKRGAIFAPIMLGTVMVLSRSLTLGQQIAQTLFIVVVFVPFTYFLDRLFYRAALRRQSGSGPGGRRS